MAALSAARWRRVGGVHDSLEWSRRAPKRPPRVVTAVAVTARKVAIASAPSLGRAPRSVAPLAIAQRPAMKSHNLRGGGRHQDRLHGAQRPSLDAALASPGFAEPTCQSDYEHWPCWSGAWLARQARSVPGSIGWLRPSIRRAAQRSRRRIPPQGMGRARRIFPNGACPPKATAAPSPLRSQSLHRAVETKSSRQLRLLPSMLVPDLS